ncbi:hypothetical protein [Marivita sp.]|uniref:hypothetical protein n=1 Tax=Marivita sp. TaxID=2003365 RepID=UPI003F6F0224
MALSFPLSTAQFFDLLPIRRFAMKPGDNRAFTELGGGELIAAGRGQRLWQGEVTLDIDVHDTIAGLDATLSLLEEVGASFLLYDPRKPFPAADPGGLLIAGSSPQIATLNANNRELTLSGLPAGYVLTPGDLIGWTYGASPTRYAVHRIVTGGSANGSGVSPSLEVTPFIRQGVSAGASAALVRPPMKAKFPEASYGAGRAVVSEAGSFSFIQVLRA